MAESESFPVELKQKPSGGLTKQWDRDNPDGTHMVRYSGADGYLYDKISDKEKTIWRRVGKT